MSADQQARPEGRETDEFQTSGGVFSENHEEMKQAVIQ